MLSRTMRPLRAAAKAPLRLPLVAQRITPVTIRNLTTETTASTPSDSPTIPSKETSSTPKAPIAAVDSAPRAIPELPYFVARSTLNNLAVYHRTDRGGNFKTTLLKRADGNVQALRLDLVEALGLTRKDITVNSTTKHIVIKGHRKDEVAQFITRLGF